MQLELLTVFMLGVFTNIGYLRMSLIRPGSSYMGKNSSLVDTTQSNSIHSTWRKWGWDSRGEVIHLSSRKRQKLNTTFPPAIAIYKKFNLPFRYWNVCLQKGAFIAMLVYRVHVTAAERDSTNSLRSVHHRRDLLPLYCFWDSWRQLLYSLGETWCCIGLGLTQQGSKDTRHLNFFEQSAIYSEYIHLRNIDGSWDVRHLLVDLLISTRTSPCSYSVWTVLYCSGWRIEPGPQLHSKLSLYSCAYMISQNYQCILIGLLQVKNEIL